MSSKNLSWITYLTFFLSVFVILFMSSSVYSQGLPFPKLADKSQMLARTNADILQKKSVRDSIEYYEERARAIAFARQNGYPIEGKKEDGGSFSLQGFDQAGFLQYYTTDNRGGAETISTDEVWPGGDAGLSLTGQNWTLAIWDGGRVRTTHTELSGKATQIDNTSSLSDHATHVTGTCIARGTNPDARGMAYNASARTFDFNADFIEMQNEASLGLLVSNHSYGTITGWDYNSNLSRWEWYGNTSFSNNKDYKFGYYNTQAEDVDFLVYNAPFYLPVKSAGNDRNDSHNGTHWVRNSSGNWVQSSISRDPDGGDSGYDCIPTWANAKNILTVGAVEELSGGYDDFTNPNEVDMSSFSGWGPTNDGRIKPDLVAKGVGVESCNADNNNGYDVRNGTSMAAPMVTGSIMLIHEYIYNTYQGFMTAAGMKGLLIHTTDECGSSSGPDYKYGWGLMNTQKAVEFAESAYNPGSRHWFRSRDSITNNDPRTYTFPHDGMDGIKITIAWTDLPGEVCAPPTSSWWICPNRMLVNDLDIRLINIDTNEEYEPWRLNPSSPSSAATRGDNDRDNVEQIYIPDLPSGVYVVTIDHKDNLVGAEQRFSIFISGIGALSVADICNQAQEIDCGQTVNDATAGAVQDVPYCDYDLDEASGKWYKFTGAGENITVSTCSSITNYDSKLGVFRGSCNNLICVEGNDDDDFCTQDDLLSTISFEATNGEEYYIYVTGYEGEFGNFQLSVDCGCVDAPYSDNDPIYQQVIAADEYCCTTEWDSDCQDAYDDLLPSLSVTPQSVNFPSSTDTETISVSSNIDWEATENVSWLSISGSDGSNNGSFTITCTQNTSTNSRTATVIVSEEVGSLSQSITVTQSGQTSSLSVSPQSVSFSSSSDTETISVSSNIDWSAAGNAGWISLGSGPSGTGNGSFTISCTQNTSTNSRTATVIVSEEGGSLSQSITVMQSGEIPGINITPQDITVDASEACVDYTISSNTDWVVTTTADWIASINPDQGTGNGTVVVCYESNPTTQGRTGVIQFDTPTASISGVIYQEGDLGNVGTPPWGEPISTILSGTLIGQAQIAGVPASAGDWVAAFDEQGNLAGSKEIILNQGIAYINLSIYGDDPNTPDDEGINAGESFTLHLYDASEDQVLDYPFTGGAQFFTEWVNTNGAPMPAYNNPNTIYNFETVHMDVIPLVPGWNLVSTDVVPVDNSILGITSMLLPENLEYITGFDGEAVFYDPSIPPIFSTLTEWVEGFGYWVRVLEVDTLKIPGQLIPTDYFKSMEEGWNLIAYLPQSAQAPQDYLADFLADGQLEYVTGFDNVFQFYDPNGLPFLNDLDFMRNSKGYWIKLEGTDNLEGLVEERNNEQRSTPVYQFIWGYTNRHEGTTIDIISSESSINWKQIIVGKEGVIWPVTIYGDDPLTEEIEGPELGEKLQFQYNDLVASKSLIFEGNMQLQNLEVIFDEQLENILRVFPTPFRETLLIQAQIPRTGDVQLIISDAYNRTIWEQSDQVLTSGQYELEWSPEQMPNGLYFVNLYVEGVLLSSAKTVFIR